MKRLIHVDFYKGKASNLRSEKEQAEAIAKKYFLPFGSLKTQVASQISAESFPMGVAHREEFTIEPIDWVGRKSGQAMSKVPLACVPINIPFFGIPISLGLCLATGAANLIAGGVGSVAGKLDKNEWQPCENKISGALKRLDLQAIIRDSMYAELNSQGLQPAIDLSGSVNSMEAIHARQLRSLLDIRLDKLWFKEADNEFFLASHADAILWDVVNTQGLRDWSLSSGTQGQGWPNEKEHSLEAICQGDTDQLMRKEIGLLLELLFRSIGKDIAAAIKENSQDSGTNIDTEK